ADPRLVERVLELARPVGGIDVHEDRPHRSSCVLNDDPLVAVGRPDPDAVALLDPPGHQATRDLLALGHQLVVGGAVALVRRYEGLTVAETGSGAAQVLEDGFAEKRFLACPMDVAQLSHGSP